MVLSTEVLKTEWLFPTKWLQSLRDKELSQRAEQLSATLKAAKRLPVWEAQGSSLVLSGRRFFKGLPAVHDPRIDACRRELLALKLGVSSKIFDCNPGFEKFAAESHLERYLNEYRQDLRIDPKEKTLSILKDGQYVAWKVAQEAMARFPKRKEVPALSWMYGPKGIQNDDVYNWTHCTPYKYDNPDKWGRRYVFELAVCCGETPHKTGDHGWLRLRTPEGEVFSAGLYRPQKRSLSDNWKAPFRIKRGHLMMPDLSEFWPDEIRTLRVGITQAQFHKMIAVIEKDKAQDQLIFQLFQSNCVLWAAHVAHEAGLEIPVGKCSVIRLLMPRPLERIIDMIPACIRTVAEKAAALFFNLLQVALGAGIVDRDVIAHNGPLVRPYIASWKELFDPKKLVLHHPATFGNETIRAVEKWRAAEVDLLKNDPELAANSELLRQRIDDIQYLLPPLV